jgi:hypothetical protein
LLHKAADLLPKYLEEIGYLDAVAMGAPAYRAERAVHVFAITLLRRTTFLIQSN